MDQCLPNSCDEYFNRREYSKSGSEESIQVSTIPSDIQHLQQAKTKTEPPTKESTFIHPPKKHPKFQGYVARKAKLPLASQPFPSSLCLIIAVQKQSGMQNRHRLECIVVLNYTRDVYFIRACHS